VSSMLMLRQPARKIWIVLLKLARYRPRERTEYAGG
jgi:hypothetical protein